MSGAERWVLASSNPGKLREVDALLRASGISIVAQSELGIDAACENATTFVENALIKAKHAAVQSGLPAIADDSGLTVDALGGAPGVHSARFAGPGADDGANIDKLLGLLLGVTDAARGASFHCALVAVSAPGDPAPLVASGEWRGRIALVASGTGGFGYDPVFFDPLLGSTAAQLPAEVKNRHSHRALALRRLTAALRTRRRLSRG
jgi:XTP/dITP diphosphohydrolase